MERKTKVKIFLLFYLLFQLHSMHPAEAMRIGENTCLANIVVERAYDDNVLLTRDTRAGSYISTISPALSLMRTAGKMDLSINYNARLAFYERRYDNQNQRIHSGTWNFGTKPMNRLSMGIKGQDTYSSLKRDEREPLVASNTIKFNDFSVTPYFEQEIGKRLKTTISYTFSERKYDQEDENLEGSKTYCGAIDLYYNLSRSIALDGEYTYTLNNFTETTPDRTEREIAAGFTWKRGSGIRASGKCGYAWEMEESGRRNNHPIMNSTLDIHPWIGTMVTATYSKSSSHASTHDTENDSFISHTASLNIRHDLLGRKVTVNYGGTYNLSDYDSVDREDKSLSGIVRIDWAMLNSVLLFLSGTYKRDRYIHNLTERRDKIYGSEGCLELKVSKSTTLALSGSYTQSRYQPDSYQVKLYDRSVKLAYSLNKSTLFEAGYQCLESVSDDQKLQPSEEDRANYQRKRCSAALRTNF